MDLFAAHHKSGQLVERACAGTGITPEDFAFVSIVGRHGLLTPTEISRDYGLSLSTVLFRANRTVELGFVERAANPADGRSFFLHLTDEGTKAWVKAGDNLHRILVDVESHLDRPSAEAQQMLRELQAAFDAVLRVPARR